MKKLINNILRKFDYEVTKLSKTKRGKAPFLHFIKKNHSRLPRLCLDVGANVGIFAEEYLAEFSDSVIYCFEPSPDCVATLVQKASQDSRIKFCPKALGNKPGKVPFHLNAKSVTNSILANSSDAEQWAPASYIAKQGMVEVDVITLDQYCQSNGIQYVDILKIDAQGFDLKVLEGARGLLEQKKVTWIYVEMMLVPLYEEQCFFHEIHQFLHPLGYPLQNLFGTVFSPQGRMKWTNGLFAHAES